MGKQNWSIFQLNFELVYKIMSYFQRIFGSNYISFLKYTSDCYNFSKITFGGSSLQFQYQKIVSVENKNESVKVLNRGRDKNFQCDFELKGGSCNDSNKGGELKIARSELGIHFSILNKTFPFSSNRIKTV